MKKLVLAIAIPAISTMAVAGEKTFLQTDNVTLYGLIDSAYINTNELPDKPGYPEEAPTDLYVKGRIGIDVKQHIPMGSIAGGKLEVEAVNNKVALRNAYVSLDHQSGSTSKVGQFLTKTDDYMSATNPIMQGALAGTMAHNSLPNWDSTRGIQLGIDTDAIGVYMTYGLVSDWGVNNAPGGESDQGRSRMYEVAIENKLSPFKIQVAHARSRADAQTYAGNLEGNNTILNISYRLNPRVMTTYSYNYVTLRKDQESSHANQHQMTLTLNPMPSVETYLLASYGYGPGEVIMKDNFKRSIYEGKYYGTQLGVRYNLYKNTSMYGAYGFQKSVVNHGDARYNENTYAIGLKHAF